jgi:hypothetical protein
VAHLCKVERGEAEMGAGGGAVRSAGREIELGHCAARMEGDFFRQVHLPPKPPHQSRNSTGPTLRQIPPPRIDTDQDDADFCLILEV